GDKFVGQREGHGIRPVAPATTAKTTGENLEIQIRGEYHWRTFSRLKEFKLKEFDMSCARIIVGLLPAFGLFVVGARAQGDVYPVIIRGKVTMKDGAPPPKQVGIQRICSDRQGDAPGPLTSKNGDYLWRRDVDPMRTRRCWLVAQLEGFVSTR